MSTKFFVHQRPVRSIGFAFVLFFIVAASSLSKNFEKNSREKKRIEKNIFIVLLLSIFIDSRHEHVVNNSRPSVRVKIH